MREQSLCPRELPRALPVSQPETGNRNAVLFVVKSPYKDADETKPTNAVKQERTRSMKQTPLFEIAVTAAEKQEWQGTVYFHDSGERRTFGSLLELIRTVEQHKPMQRQETEET